MTFQRPLACLIVAVCAVASAAQRPLYKDATAPVETRVADLLGRMTPEEKIGQLRCLMGWDMYVKNADGTVNFAPQFAEAMASDYPPGALWATLRADPWTHKSLANGLNPQLASAALDSLQRYAVEHTRLGIPLLFAEEGAHGLMAIGAATFPTGLALASTWDEALLERTGQAIGRDGAAQGAGMLFGPVLDVARDPRWSRMEEGLGEDPCLSARLGSALLRGMQASVPACPKHLAAYGVPRGGHNGAEAAVGPRQLRADLLPPFEAAVRAGAKAVMTSYNGIDGIPCTANRWLLSDNLRGTWGFGGIVLSDLFAIDGLCGTGKPAANRKEAAALALRAGVDVDLGGQCYGAPLRQAVAEGMITETDIDTAVARVLRLKFEAGLFERPYASGKASPLRADSLQFLLTQTAREGIVLLKNDGLLPLRRDVRKIAVIGPNADAPYNQLGDYTAPQPEGKVETLLEGIRRKAGARTTVAYAKGCAVRDTTGATDSIAAAVELARSADVIVLTLGGSSARDFRTSYAATGAAAAEAASASRLPDMDCGEGYDRSTLSLLGRQAELLDEIANLGRPLIVVYVEGRPLDMTAAAQKANALLCAWYPGERGGEALAELLFGDACPSGKLPVSVPRSVGQLPVYYSQGNTSDYMDGSAAPLYPFGYGLSYTTFEYADISDETAENSDTLRHISFRLTNTGGRRGAEVVQLYVTDEQASVTVPPLQLRDFRRIELEAGASKRVDLYLTRDDLSLWDASMRRTLEPGRFTYFVGSSSQDRRLQGSFVITR